MKSYKIILTVLSIINIDQSHEFSSLIQILRRRKTKTQIKNIYIYIER